MTPNINLGHIYFNPVTLFPQKTWQLSLLQAHHYGRKADQLVAKEKYEEAISCHIEAAGKVMKPIHT